VVNDTAVALSAGGGRARRPMRRPQLGGAAAEEAKRLPAELVAVDGYLDDERFIAPWRVLFSKRLGCPSVPIDTLLRLLYLKHRYGWFGLRELLPGGRRLDWLAAVLPHPPGPARAPPDHAGQAGSTMLPRPSSNSLINRALVAKLPRQAAARTQAAGGYHGGGGRPRLLVDAAYLPELQRGLGRAVVACSTTASSTSTTTVPPTTISQLSGGYLATFRNGAIFVQLTMTGRSRIFEGSAIMRFLLKDGPVEAQSHLIGVLTARELTLRFDPGTEAWMAGSSWRGFLDSSGVASRFRSRVARAGCRMRTCARRLRRLQRGLQDGADSGR
jgi:hypothetical protein